MNIDPKELEAGTEIEHEHTHDDALARKIASDHLREDPHYYSKLKAAGLEEETDEGALTPQEAGMAECGGMDDGCPEDAGLPVAPEAKPAPVAAMVTIAAQPGQSGQAPLTSSGLGKGGANKPLTSTNLETPPDKKVGPNKVATTKTPPMAGGTSITNHSDPLDHFGSEMLGLCEGGSQIKKK